MSLKLIRMCFPVTFRCNLRCVLCIERAPYYVNPYHPSFSSLTAQIDALFELTDYIDKLDLTGGEPFLRKELPEFIRYIHNSHRNNINTLRITTNGTITIPTGFLDAARLWGRNVYVIIDKYNISTISDEIDSSLSDAGIPHEIRDYSNELHCGGWVDFGELSKKHNDFAAREVYNKCVVPKLGFWSCMVDGRIFPCARARLLYENGAVDISVNVFDTSLTGNEKKERLMKFLGDEVIEACKYCNGMCDDSPRFPPAVQISV